MAALVIDKFKAGFTGRIILPENRDYEAARRVHNGAVVRHPALIALCANVVDVARAVEFARENQLLVALRSGGHSQVGHSVCDGGIVIDLSGMKQISIDPVHRIARAQAGVLAGELDQATQTCGLATPLGQCPSVGLGGLSTGGGFGWLTGRYGLTCDNMISARVVSADGHLLRAADDEHPDLFWGLRGGGGNYGVAVEFEYRLHPVGEVFGGMLYYKLEQSRALFQFVREYLRRAPDELGFSFGIRPMGEESAFAVALCHSSEPRDAQQVLAPLLAFGTPAAGSIGPLPYLKMQSVMGESPPGSLLFTRGGFMPELSDGAIDAILEAAALNQSTAKSLWMDFYHGAMCRIAQSATAFPVRESGYGFLIQSQWNADAVAPDQIQWVDDTIGALAPFAADLSYVANLGDETPERIRRCYGPNYARLAELKRKYDPDNLFRLNQNIAP